MELDRPGDAGRRRREAMAVERTLLEGQDPPPHPRVSESSMGWNRELKCLKTTGDGQEEEEQAAVMSGAGAEWEERRKPEKQWYMLSRNITLPARSGAVGEAN